MNCMRRMSCTSCVRGNICMSWIVCKRCTSLMNCMNRMGDILLKRLKRRRQTPLHATHRSLRLPMSANKPSGRDDREFSPRVLRARNDQKQYKPRAEQKEGNAKKRISRKESLEATEAGGSRKTFLSAPEPHARVRGYAIYPQPQTIYLRGVVYPVM